MSTNHKAKKALVAQFLELKRTIHQMDEAGKAALALDSKAVPCLLEGGASVESNRWGSLAFRSHTLACILDDLGDLNEPGVAVRWELPVGLGTVEWGVPPECLEADELRDIGRFLKEPVSR